MSFAQRRRTRIISWPAQFRQSRILIKSLCRSGFLTQRCAGMSGKRSPRAKNRLAWLGASPLRKLCGILESHISHKIDMLFLIRRAQKCPTAVVKMIECAKTISRMSWTCVRPADLNLERRANRMLALFTSPPSITATSAPCPQCGEQMYIKLVVPDPAISTVERHTFECGECGLVRGFTIKLPKRRNKARPRRGR